MKRRMADIMGRLESRLCRFRDGDDGLLPVDVAVGRNTEKQRKALADYFAPTIVQTKTDFAGSNGLLGVTLWSLSTNILTVPGRPGRAP